jgi:hypothetical protein
MEVPATAVGKTTSCPYCHQLLQIPAVSPTSAPGQVAKTGKQAASQTGPPAKAPNNPREDIWTDLYPRAEGDAYEDPLSLSMSNAWQASSQHPIIRGLTFANVFALVFQTAFPSCLMALALLLTYTAVAVPCVLLAQFIGTQLLEAVRPQSVPLAYTLVLTPLGIMLVLLNLGVAAIAGMVCNTALHAIRKKPVTSQVIFSTGGCYAGTLFVSFAMLILSLLQQFGIPWLMSQVVADQGTAVSILLIGMAVFVLLQVVVGFLLASVPYAMIDGESLFEAIQTSASIYLSNFLTITAATVCCWLGLLVLTVFTCGLGGLACAGLPFFWAAAIYHLADK